jgi:uncharacterized RDD family membrane protein YckC
MTLDKNVTVGTRLGSMFLDHIFMTMICMLFFIPMVMNDINQTSPQDEKSFFGLSFFLGLLGFMVYFSKDSFNGRSLAKRITKLQVVENKTGQVASPLRCFIRNIFCVLWPIEVLVTLINPTRRIGDRVAGTRIVYYDPVLIEQLKTFGKVE